MAVRTFDEFLAEQAMNENIAAVLGNVFKTAAPTMQGMIQKSWPKIQQAAQKYGPQMIQSATQEVMNQMGGQSTGQKSQPGQTSQQGQVGQKPQATQQTQFTQQTQAPQTNNINPQQSKAFDDMFQQTLNKMAAQGGQWAAQGVMNQFGSQKS